MRTRPTTVGRWTRGSRRITAPPSAAGGLGATDVRGAVSTAVATTVPSSSPPTSSPSAAHGQATTAGGTGAAPRSDRTRCGPRAARATTPTSDADQHERDEEREVLDQQQPSCVPAGQAQRPQPHDLRATGAAARRRAPGRRPRAAGPRRAATSVSSVVGTATRRGPRASCSATSCRTVTRPARAPAVPRTVRASVGPPTSASTTGSSRPASIEGARQRVDVGEHGDLSGRGRHGRHDPHDPRSRAVSPTIAESWSPTLAPTASTRSCDGDDRHVRAAPGTPSPAGRPRCRRSTSRSSPRSARSSVPALVVRSSAAAPATGRVSCSGSSCHAGPSAGPARRSTGRRASIRTGARALGGPSAGMPSSSSRRPTSRRPPPIGAQPPHLVAVRRRAARLAPATELRNPDGVLDDRGGGRDDRRARRAASAQGDAGAAGGQRDAGHAVRGASSAPTSAQVEPGRRADRAAARRPAGCRRRPARDASPASPT